MIIANMIKLNLLCIFSFLLLSKQSVGMVIDTPSIKAGKAKLTGSITSPDKIEKDSVFVNIIVPQPISGEQVKYKAFVDASGKFSMDVETTISLIAINISLNPEKSLLVKLKSGGVTNVDIAYNSDNEIKNIKVTPSMNQNDMTKGLEVMMNMLTYKSGRTPEPLYNKSTSYFLNYAKTILLERLEIVNKDTLLSKELKEILAKDLGLTLYNTHVLPYEEEMRLNFGNTNKDKSKKPVIQKIDRTYYRFLRDFNLNDPEYLNCFTFPEFQLSVLRNETLNLPEIKDSDIPTWLAKVKAILVDLVGFKEGPYYDVLAANAYARQLNEEVKSLSEKQKENIANYWKNGEIAKILLRKNQQVMELEKLKSPLVVNDVSSVPDDKVIETIVSKYKNKVILIDLWATWCGPCLQAMQEFRSTKGEFHDKDVVFVYLASSSSPKKLWEEKIKGIGSEHYYLKPSQWNYIINQFDFNGIPSYLLYDKNGILKNKFTAFPGNEKVKEMINSLL